MTLGMLKAGAPFSPIMTFVISSPLLNPIIITMIGALMGIKACLLYFSVTFIGSIVFGIILEKSGGAAWVKNVQVKQSRCGTASPVEPRTFTDKIKVSFLTACQVAGIIQVRKKTIMSLAQLCDNKW
jgi:uncharacterized protein